MISPICIKLFLYGRSSVLYFLKNNNGDTAHGGWGLGTGGDTVNFREAKMSSVTVIIF